MASLPEYDEFGNYIGPDIDSDEDEDMETFQQEPVPQPLEDFDEEEEEPADERALMQIGMLYISLLSG
jgi:U5 small nuclear ribonucleoprotein component